jgi:hypothetical protein
MESSTILEKFPTFPTGCVSADVWRFHVDLDLLASWHQDEDPKPQETEDKAHGFLCDLWGPCFVGFSIVFSVSHGSFNSLI